MNVREYPDRSRDEAPTEPLQGGGGKSVAYTMRFGKYVAIDEVFDAWTSGDLDRMLGAIDIETNAIDRHFLLMGIVGATYKKRSDPRMAQLCGDTAELHLKEFRSIVDPLKENMYGVLPRVSTFQYYATLLTELEQFDKAVQVCEAAIGYGLHDGTKSGFLGRISRIRRVQGGT